MILNFVKNIKNNDNRNDLNVKVFNEKTEEEIILFLSMQLNEKNFVKDFNNGKIKCDSCGNTLKPYGKGGFSLGGIIPTSKGPKIICQSIECFEKSL